mmetsp:Transcript_23826/g.72928  ORF Transcript_23826/g.72928 Transcript_23826/m.72928 type:complete len:105 (+) Transcript_23826:875-1189(+)
MACDRLYEGWSTAFNDGGCPHAVECRHGRRQSVPQLAKLATRQFLILQLLMLMLHSSCRIDDCALSVERAPSYRRTSYDMAAWRRAFGWMEPRLIAHFLTFLCA